MDTVLIFSPNKSFLIKNRIIAVSLKYSLLQIVPNNSIESDIEFFSSSSNIIVTRQRRHENHRRHVLKAINPFPSLRFLSADIEYVEHILFHFELLLDHTSGTV